MSLVNDMLRDLEQRNENPAKAPGNQSAVKAAQYVEEEANSSVPRYVLWGIGIAALLMTSWLLWQEQSNQQTLLDQPDVIDHSDKLSNPLVNNEHTDSGESKKDSVNDSAATVPEVLPGKVVSGLPEVAQPTLSLTKLVDVSEIKWAGTDFGGDLVVRLSGDANIQVFNQKEKAIVIALDDVALKTALPLISSPFIQGLHLDIDAQKRTLLTLTTHVPSQFAFRIEPSPTTLILGVIPQQIEPEPKKQPDTLTEIEVKPSESKVQTLDVAQQKVVTPLKSGRELQVGGASDELRSIPKTVKPVEKSNLALTDRQAADRAHRSISKGNIDGAEQLLRKIISERPNQAETSRGMLATLLLSKGNIPDSQRLLTESLKLYPNNSVLKKLQARIWMSEGKSRDVIALLEVQPPSIATDSEYYELMATGFQQQGRPEQTAQIYYQLLQQNNDVPRWWVGMGYALEQVKRYTDARNAYQSGLQIPSIDRSLKNYARQRVQALAGR